jgi:sec-independent protein translocase protein TatB
MEFLGIGPLELAFIILLAIIIFGPKDIVNTSKTVGKSLNKLVRSDTWKTINQTTRELKNLPNRLMRETGLDEVEKTTREEMAKVDADIQHSIRPIPLPGDPPRIVPTPADPSTADPTVETPEKGSAG